MKPLLAILIILPLIGAGCCPNYGKNPDGSCRTRFDMLEPYGQDYYKRCIEEGGIPYFGHWRGQPNIACEQINTSPEKEIYKKNNHL